MAHIAETSAVYRRDAVNRSTSIAAVKPSSLAFLGELLGQEKICKEKRKSIATLFDSIALFTAAGKKLRGDSVTVRHIQIECMQSKRIVVWLAISFILVIPISFSRLHAIGGVA